MGWFGKWCRNVGLMVHHIRRPEGGGRWVVRRRVEQQRQGRLTLRRTTIEEIEIQPDQQGPSESEKEH